MSRAPVRPRSLSGAFSDGAGSSRKRTGFVQDARASGSERTTMSTQSGASQVAYQWNRSAATEVSGLSTCDLLGGFLSAPGETRASANDIQDQDCVLQSITEKIRYLEAESELPSASQVQQRSSPDFQTALYTDSLVRQLYESQERTRALDAELAKIRDESNARMQQLEQQLSALNGELVPLRAALRDAQQDSGSASELAEKARADAQAAQEELRLAFEERRRSQTRTAAAEQQLEVVTGQLRAIDGEAAASHRRLEAAERSFNEHLLEKNRQADDLRAECAELLGRLQCCEATLRCQQARERAATLPVSVPEGNVVEELRESQRLSEEQRAKFEASVLEIQGVADRRGARLDLLETENACLRDRSRALQEASDRDAPKLRDYEDGEMERRQLRELGSKLQRELLEARQALHESQADAEALLGKLADKLDADLLRKLPEDAQLAWLAPLEHRVQEAQQLLQQARNAEVAAISAQHSAQAESMDATLQLSREQEDGERLQRRLVESQMRLDQNIERSAGLSDALAESETNTESRLEALRQELRKEQQDALGREREECHTKVASLEAAAVRRDQELASLSQFKIAIGRLEASGGLSSFGQSLAVLTTMVGCEQQKTDTPHGASTTMPPGVPAA